MSCEHEFDDAAYVLGALAPAERSAYERHLSGCAPCTTAVGELAGIPGLLARAEPERPAYPPVPDTLLPALVRSVHAQQRRRRWVTRVGAAAAAVAVIASLGIAVDRSFVRGSSDPTTRVAAVSMHTVGADEAVTANLSLTPVAWGTRLELTCDERSEPLTDAGASSYAMYVHTRDGRVERVATWRSVPGGVAHVSGATSTDRGDITEVDVRNAAGVPVLNLDDTGER